MKRMWEGEKKILFILIILFLTGCASSINLSEIKSLPQNEGIVFGRVKVIGEEKKFGHYIRLIILPENSSEAIDVPMCEYDCTFIWHLPAGSYTIASVRLSKSKEDLLGGRTTTVRTLRIFAYYKVLENKATYIGTLTITFSGTYIADEYELSSRTFKNKFPDMKVEVIKNLMQMEERR